MELHVAGREYSGAEAANVGLVNQAFPEDELEDRVLAIARRIAEVPPAVVTVNKRFVYAALEARGGRDRACGQRPPGGSSPPGTLGGRDLRKGEEEVRIASRSVDEHPERERGLQCEQNLRPWPVRQFIPVRIGGSRGPPEGTRAIGAGPPRRPGSAGLELFSGVRLGCRPAPKRAWAPRHRGRRSWRQLQAPSVSAAFS